MQTGTDFTKLPDIKETIRGIRPQVRALYGCKAIHSETTGDVEGIAYQIGPNRWKVRTLPKSFVQYGKGQMHLFGKDVCKSNMLVIVGGEEDAMAGYQMFVDVTNNPVSVVSLPSGETGLRAISDDLDWIRSHKKIVLALDMDDIGKEGTNKLAILIDKPVFVAELPEKDPNDCLLKGKQKDFVSAVLNAKRWTPSGIVRVSDVLEDALKKPEWGIPFPWPTLTELTFGIRPGDGYYIGAGVKVGKSDWLNTLAAHLIELKKKILVVKAEELPGQTVKRIAGKIDKTIYHRPDIEIDEDKLRQTIESLENYLFLFDRKNQLDWDVVKAAIRHCVIVEGVRFVFIDPITCFTDGMDASDANAFLQKFARELDTMAKDLGFTYFCFCHLNAPKTGPAHEFGGRVESRQFTGSRVMMRACTYAIGIERNKDPELSEEERNTSYFVLLEDRNFGNTGRFPVFYDRNTGTYLEPKEDF